MSGHTHIHTHIHTYTQDNYSNPRCACAPRVNNYCVIITSVLIYSKNTPSLPAHLSHVEGVLWAAVLDCHVHSVLSGHVQALPQPLQPLLPTQLHTSLLRERAREGERKREREIQRDTERGN